MKRLYSIGMSRPTMGLLIIFTMLLTSLAFVGLTAGPASAHHPELSVEGVCYDDAPHIKYTAVAWATIDSVRRLNSDIRVSVDGVERASGAFTAANGYSFSGYIPVGAGPHASSVKAVGDWGNGVTVTVAGGQVRAGTPEPVTVPADCVPLPPAISVSQDCDSVDVQSEKDISNIIVHYGDGTYAKFDGLTGTTWTLSVPTANGYVVEIWVKSGNNWEGGDRDDEPLPAEYNSGQSVGEYFGLSVPTCTTDVTPVAPSHTPGDCDSPAQLVATDTGDYTWIVRDEPDGRYVDAVATSDAIVLVGQTTYGPYDMTQTSGEVCESTPPEVSGYIVCVDTPEGFVYALSYTVVQDGHGYLDESSFVPSEGFLTDYDNGVIHATVEWTGVDGGDYPATIEFDVTGVGECPLDDVEPPSGTAFYDCDGELQVTVDEGHDYEVSEDGTQLLIFWTDKYDRSQTVVADITPAPSAEECESTPPEVTAVITCIDTADGFVYTLSYTVVQDMYGYLDSSSFVPPAGILAGYDGEMINAAVEWTGIDGGSYPAVLGVAVAGVGGCPLDDVEPPSGTSFYNCDGVLTVNIADGYVFDVSGDGTQLLVDWTDKYGQLQTVVIDITPAPSAEECTTPTPTPPPRVEGIVLTQTPTQTPTATPVSNVTPLAFTGAESGRLALGALLLVLAGALLVHLGRRCDERLT
jgi:hypothetical protein